MKMQKINWIGLVMLAILAVGGTGYLITRYNPGDVFLSIAVALVIAGWIWIAIKFVMYEPDEREPEEPEKRVIFEYEKRLCSHPYFGVVNYHDNSKLCTKCNCIIEQDGIKIEDLDK